MRTNALLPLVLLVGVSAALGHVNTQKSSDPNTDAQSGAAPDATAALDSPDWLFPVAKLNESLPGWLRFGGQYRGRLEGPTGIGFTGTRDFYLLDRLRVHVTIQPKEWLLFHGEVQDSRIFFNHHIPNANPFQDSWTLWEGYAQVGSATAGWVNVVAGRQALSFGDERVIGPSNWLNVGRTFNVARVDLHHSNNKVSVFAASVVPGDSNDLHNALPGNNLYGVYGSFENLIPKATFEPYVLWRVAPSNSALPETLGRGHLDEVTIGLHMRRVHFPPTSTTPPNLTGRQVRSAHPPYARGQAMPASGKRLAKLPRRRAFLSRATTPPERKIRWDVTGIPLTSSILLIMTSTASPIRSAAGTLCSSESA
jgi:hypothetical protein